MNPRSPVFCSFYKTRSPLFGQANAPTPGFPAGKASMQLVKTGQLPANRLLRTAREKAKSAEGIDLMYRAADATGTLSMSVNSLDDGYDSISILHPAQTMR